MNFSPTEAYSKTGYLKSADQTSIFYRYYPLEDSKAFVLLVHGFGEHSGRYSHVIDRLRGEGFEIFCIDLRGHGHSKGKRGDVTSFSLYEDDVLSALDHIEQHIARKKLFILAHSMGALVSLRALKRSRHNLEGMVMSSPLFSLTMPMPIWKDWASALAACVVPDMRVSTGIRGRHLSTDQKFVHAYDNDPLVLKNLSLRTFRQILGAYRDTSALSSSLSVDLFMQVAGRDPVVDSASSERWFNTIDRHRIDARMKIYPEFLHEIYNETERSEAIDDAVLWLNERTAM